MSAATSPHGRCHRHVVAASVAVTVTVLLVTGCGSDESPPVTDDTSATPSIDIHRAPEIDSWTTGPISVPLGTIDGPTSTSGAPFTGYSRTPQGAALAAMDQSVQLSTASDGRWSTILPVVTVAGAGRDLWAGNRALISTSGIDPAVAPTIVGYTIEQYTPDHADVSIVQRFPDDSLAATSTPVVWTDADWKLTMPVLDANPVQSLASLPSDLVDLEGTKP